MPNHPNILLLCADQLAQRAVGAYGDPWARTPAIDSLPPHLGANNDTAADPIHLLQSQPPRPGLRLEPGELPALSCRLPFLSGIGRPTDRRDPGGAGVDRETGLETQYRHHEQVFHHDDIL